MMLLTGRMDIFLPLQSYLDISGTKVLLMESAATPTYPEGMASPKVGQWSSPFLFDAKTL
jgi:hypothetical protein